jgi:DNA-directed RNA polymerase specialized sigma24 family protein
MSRDHLPTVSRDITIVEVVRLYSNPEARLETLQSSLANAISKLRPGEQPATRQTQTRLAPHQVTAMAAAYHDGKTIKELAQQYGVHRTTVSALMRRSDVPQRLRGLAAGDLGTAALLYEQGWSLARLGERFSVDAATVWRALRAAGVVMRPPSRVGAGRQPPSRE